MALNRLRNICSLPILCLIVAALVLRPALGSDCGTCRQETCGSTDHCQHGTILNDCNCCQICLKGENETCGGDLFQGICAPGLDCRRNETLYPNRAEWEARGHPSSCHRNESAVTEARSSSPLATVALPPTNPTAASPSTEQLGTSSTEGSTNSPSTYSTADFIGDLITQSDNECTKPACSLSFCTAKQKANRICSARGLEYRRSETNRCQDTSCKACFLLVQIMPDCSQFSCSNRVNKSCLGDFFRCLEEGLEGRTPTLLKLEDPMAAEYEKYGRIVCNVPELL